MKFIACADVHLAKKLYNEPGLENDQKDYFKQVCNLAITNKVDYLVIVGDLYDHNHPSAELISFVRDQVDLLRSHNINTVGIAGDHDKPIDGATWCAVSDIQPVTSDSCFFGFDYQDAYDDDILSQKITTHGKDEKVQWLFLHGQVPVLFPFVEKKKRLDFENLKLTAFFPNIKGVILGDIHTPTEGELIDDGKRVYIGYCGTTGVNEFPESQMDKSVLYYDGDNLSRLPLVNEREFIKINFTGEEVAKLNPGLIKAACESHKKPPLFIVDYDQGSFGQINQLDFLSDLGIVIKSKQTKFSSPTYTVNIRSEASSDERVVNVLKEFAANRGEVVVKLASRILAGEEVKNVIDEFKLASL